MEMITVKAKTIEEAITKASIQLSVPSSDLVYEVVEKGSAGFLGIGSKEAVIKASIKEEEAEPVKVEPKKEAVRETEVTTAVKKESIEVEEKVVKSEKVVKASDEVVAICKSFIEDTIKEMSIKGSVKAEADEDGEISITVEGENMGALIGKRGQTLDSLQYLVNRVANKYTDDYVRVKLDTENYRARRKETLENLAKNISHKVKRTRRPVSLEPMNPYERRIIHSALQGDKSVTTHSEGDEPYRKVVVTLAKR